MFVRSKDDGYILIKALVIMGTILALVLMINKIIVINYIRAGEYYNRQLKSCEIGELPADTLATKLNSLVGEETLQEFFKDRESIHIVIDNIKYTIKLSEERLIIQWYSKSYFISKNIQYKITDDNKIKLN